MTQLLIRLLTLLVSLSSAVTKGMVALALPNEFISSTEGARFCQFRYEDFDHKVVENAIGPNLSSK